MNNKLQLLLQPYETFSSSRCRSADARNFSNRWVTDTSCQRVHGVFAMFPTTAHRKKKHSKRLRFSQQGQTCARHFARWGLSRTICIFRCNSFAQCVRASPPANHRYVEPNRADEKDTSMEKAIVTVLIACFVFNRPYDHDDDDDDGVTDVVLLLMFRQRCA